MTDAEKLRLVCAYVAQWTPLLDGLPERAYVEATFCADARELEGRHARIVAAESEYQRVAEIVRESAKESDHA